MWNENESLLKGMNYIYFALHCQVSLFQNMFENFEIIINSSYAENF